MRVDEFDFDLPDDLIALRPVSPRHAARQLVVRPDAPLYEQTVLDFPDLLTEKDLVIFNDTKVLPSSLTGRRGEMVVDLNLHKREGPVTWRAFARKTKRMKAGDVIDFGGVTAHLTEKFEGGEIRLEFDVPPGSLEGVLAEIGKMPLPPYIASKRPVDPSDESDYQTMFARREGAVAAPTASLHFTDTLMTRLAEKKIATAQVTLHVGAGTFMPVKVDDTADHKMHAEWGDVSEDVAARINATRQNGGRIVAIGTTVLRVLESAATEEGAVRAFNGDTSIFITPGYRFRCVDILMTNFHLPRSTLFMLVSAFAGVDKMREAYQYAMTNGFRFYSYGDSSVLFKSL